MNLLNKLDPGQRKTLADFFKDLSVAWCVGLFVVPQLSAEFDFLTILRYIIDAAIALTISLKLSKEKI